MRSHPTLTTGGGIAAAVVSRATLETAEEALDPSTIEMMAATNDMDWLMRIACRHLSLDEFFTKPGRALDPEIKKMCGGCEVRDDCLKHAYDRNIDFGHFGGLSPSVRSRNTYEQAVEILRSEEDCPPQPM